MRVGLFAGMSSAGRDARARDESSIGWIHGTSSHVHSIGLFGIGPLGMW